MNMKNDYLMDEVLQEEDVFVIELQSASGVPYPNVPVYGDSTFKDVLEEYAGNIGIDLNAEKIECTNKRTGLKTNILTERLDKYGFQNGDVLMVSDAGTVA